MISTGLCCPGPAALPDVYKICRVLTCSCRNCQAVQLTAYSVLLIEWTRVDWRARECNTASEEPNSANSVCVATTRVHQKFEHQLGVSTNFYRCTAV